MSALFNVKLNDNTGAYSSIIRDTIETTTCVVWSKISCMHMHVVILKLNIF